MNSTNNDACTGFKSQDEATPNAAITRPVTVGPAVTQPSAIAERDISHVMDCVREGRFESKDLRALILTIRGLPPAQAAIAAGMKKSLPWFSGSTFHRRRGNEFFKAAWFLVFDLDHVGDIEGLKRRALDKLPWLRYAFQSVRDGVKLVAEFATPITKEDDFRTLWKYLALQIGKLLEVEADATPDPARACFLSYDPGLLVNSSCRPLEVQKTLREAEAIEMLTSALNGTPVSTGRTAGFIRQYPLAAQTCPSSEQNRINPVDRPDKSGVPVDTPICVQSTSPRHPATTSQPPTDDYEKAAKVVQKLAQMVIPYSDWYRIGLALYAGFGERGRPLWNLFLANPHYRDTQRGLDAKWHSFRGVREITLATLFEIGGRYGCL
ncbi:MAG: BT4734/BF3469 family protein [Candidatus Cloacimonetes bacterium]|nr:BT4734/BF3469 family protein [Candidatus Cloacimonadota bacterium]